MEKINSQQESLPTKDEWEREYTEIKKLRNELVDLVKKIYKDAFYDVWDNICIPFEEKILQYPNHEKYLVSHVFRFGGSEYEWSPKIDFPGDLSVKQFYIKKIKELSQK